SYTTVLRTAVDATAAVLGGPNSLHTTALDETLALPTERSAEIALRTQQVLAEETGVTNVADPLGGSWYLEQLTDRLEAEAEETFARILARGEQAGGHPIGPMTAGLLRGIDDGWFTGQIAEAAFRYQADLEAGRKRVVGVNCHTETVTGELEILRVGHEVEEEQRRVLAERRATRDDDTVRASLGALREGARGRDNLVPRLLDAARAEATLGEMCGLLREEWGEWREPSVF